MTTVSAPDPERYLVGGGPRSVVVSARIARFLDGVVLDRVRREHPEVLNDVELNETLIALHIAGIEWKATAAGGRTPLPRPVLSPELGHDLLSTDGVAMMLGCKPRNVRDLHQRGRLLGERHSGRLLFDPSAVAGYLAQRDGTPA